MSLLTDLIANLHYNTIIDHEPFTHAVCKPFWPEAFYEKLTDNLPNDSIFITRGNIDGGYGGGKTRMATRLWERPIWCEAIAALESEAFVFALGAILQVEHVSGLVSRALLHKDASGYAISPHTDTASKYISYVCYFAQDMAHQHLGTILLRPKTGIEAKRQNEHQFWYNYEPVKMIGYLPNSLSFWGPSDSSYHAVDVRFTPEDPVQSRLSIRGFVYDLTKGPLPYVVQCDEDERHGAAV